MRLVYDRSVKDLCLTRSQWCVLTHLFRSNGVSQTELAYILEVENPTLGRLIDRVPVKPLFFGIVVSQIVLFALAAQSTGWIWYVLAVAYMISVFGAIPFSDAMVVRYIDDSMRSRVSGIRIAISFGISSLAVYLLGPFVKSSGFTQLLIAMSFIAAISAFIVLWLPGESQMRAARQGAGAG